MYLDVAGLAGIAALLLALVAAAQGARALAGALLGAGLLLAQHRLVVAAGQRLGHLWTRAEGCGLKPSRNQVRYPRTHVAQGQGIIRGYYKIRKVDRTVELGPLPKQESTEKILTYQHVTLFAVLEAPVTASVLLGAALPQVLAELLALVLDKHTHQRSMSYFG